MLGLLADDDLHRARHDAAAERPLPFIRREGPLHHERPDLARVCVRPRKSVTGHEGGAHCDLYVLERRRSEPEGSAFRLVKGHGVRDQFAGGAPILLDGVLDDGTPFGCSRQSAEGRENITIAQVALLDVVQVDGVRVGILADEESGMGHGLRAGRTGPGPLARFGNRRARHHLGDQRLVAFEGCRALVSLGRRRFARRSARAVLGVVAAPSHGVDVDARRHEDLAFISGLSAACASPSAARRRALREKTAPGRVRTIGSNLPAAPSDECIERRRGDGQRPRARDVMSFNLRAIRTAVFVLMPLASLSAFGAFRTAHCAIPIARSELPRETAVEASPDDLFTLVAGNTEFAIDAYGVLGNQYKGHNLFFSPYSISMALSMAYAGARGKTADEMARAMRFLLPRERLHRACGVLYAQVSSRSADGVVLQAANSMWAREKTHFEKPFLDTLAQSYGAGVRLVNFAGDPEGSRKRINAWVADQT